MRRAPIVNANDPSLRSFIDVPADSHFPIQNLPFGVFHRGGAEPRIGVAIGDHILDLCELATARLLDAESLAGDFFQHKQSLNEFMAKGQHVWSAVRARISRLLRHDELTLRDDRALCSRALVPMADAEMVLPAVIGDYT